MFLKHSFSLTTRPYRQVVYNTLFPTTNGISKSHDGEIIYAKDIFYNCLKKHNVSTAFIYSGGSIMPWIDTLYKSDINYYVNSHEQNCGHALTGFSKSNIDHKEKAIVMTTSGPGFTNLITPMLDMTNDSTPGVFITGQVPLSAVGTNAFQEAPSIALSKHVTKYSTQIKSILDIELELDKAFNMAYSGKNGAVHIDIPKCVASSSLLKSEYDNLMTSNLEYTHSNGNLIPNIFKKLDNYNSCFDKTINIINKSNKPIIYLGQGCVESYDLLRKFAIIGNIPVTSTIHGCGIFDEDHDLSLQWCGMHGNATSNYSLQEADCIIALGSRFDDRTTGNTMEYGKAANKAYKHKKGGIVHVNLDVNEIRKNIDSHFNVIMKCGTFLDCVLPLVKYNNDRNEWLSQISKWKNDFPFNTNTPVDNTLNTQFVIDKLGKWLNTNNPNFFISTGVGNHQMMSAQFIKWNSPNQFLTSGSLGVMGTGLPYAIGAQIANPGHLVLDIDGDGSFNHTLAELKTIANYGLPVKIAIMNDGQLSMVKAWEHLFFGSRYVATNLGDNPDYVVLAESFGIPALSCDSQDDLDITIDTFLSWDGPVLCDFKVKSDLCLPLVKPGNALDDMFLFGDNVTKMNISEVPG